MTANETLLVRTMWLATLLLVAGVGGGCVWWPATQQIGQVHAHAKDSYDEANAIVAKLQRASELREAEARVRRDLRELGGYRSQAAASAALLRLLDEESRSANVSVTAIAPDASEKTATDELAGTPVTLSMRGRFRNVVAALSDLPKHDVLLDIQDADLRSSAASRRPVLDVVVRATIYHLNIAEEKEPQRVRSIR